MATRLALLLITFSVLHIDTTAMDSSQGAQAFATAGAEPVFFPASCQRVCSNNRHHRIPLEAMSTLGNGNRVSQWALVLLVQVRVFEHALDERDS
jgi:hypothetical protein